MKKILLAFSFMAACLSSTLAFATDTQKVSVQSAYEDSNGRVIVSFQPGNENPEFMKGNLVFYGTEKNLFQLSQKGASGGPQGESVTFEDPRLQSNGQFESSLANGKPAKALVKCDGEKVDYKPISADRLKKLQASVRAAKTALTALPTGTEAGHLHTPCDRFFPADSQPQKKPAEKKPKSAV